MSTVRHGTYAGAQWHQKHGVPICLDCKEAGRQYMAQQRQNPEKRAEARAVTRAYHRALRRLAGMHPTEIAILAAEERAKIRTGERP